MAIFTIQAPDGRKIKIEAGDEATAVRGAQEWVAANPKSSVATPPAGLNPGSREYALWARDQAIAGNRLPQVSPEPPAPQFTGPNQDLGSKLFTAGGSFIEGVPIAGPTLIDLATQGRAALHGMTPDEVRQEFAEAKAANPMTAAAGNITGGVATLLPLGMTALGGRLLGTTGSVGQQIGMGSASGALISGADTAARGGTPEEIARNAAIGGTLGALLPAGGAYVKGRVQQAAQNRATSRAIADAPSSTDLKDVARSLFQSVDNAGVIAEPQAFGQFVVGLARDMRGKRINQKLDPKSWAALEEMGAVMGAGLQGAPIRLSDLHNLRQIAQLVSKSPEGRDAAFGRQIVDALDKFIEAPTSMIAPAGSTASRDLMKAISTWGRAKRVQLVEDAIETARNSASGFENGLRVEFRKLLKSRGNLFSATERNEIKKIVRGTAGANLAKLIGKFGFGGGNASNMLGGTIGSGLGATVGSAFGPLGSVLGAGLAGGGASVMRGVAENLTSRAAERAARVVGTPNIPVLATSPYRGALPPALVPLELTQEREPLRIMVRGGSNSSP